MARIALVQPLKYREYASSADVVGLYEGNTAFGFLAHYLKSKGHEIIVADANLHEDYIGRLMEFGPEVAGVRFEGYESTTVASAIREFKQYEPNAQVVLGGPAVMLYQERQRELLEESSADYLVYGDGIPALHEIAVGQLDSPGVYYLRDGAVMGRGVAPSRVELWQTDAQVLGYEGGTFRVVSSIGCPYRCGFCDERMYTPKVLYRPMSLVLKDLLELDRVKKASQFAFCDPIFLLRKGRLRELDEGMRKLRLSQQITFQTRADRVLNCLEELNAAKGRIARVDLGVESFVQAQLDRWNKRVTVEENVAAIESIRELGMFPFLYLIMGDLESDEAEFSQVLDFFREKPEYLMITQPSGLVQYHDERDGRYSGTALAFEYFFHQLWCNVRLAWSATSLEGFKERRVIPAENKGRLSAHFENVRRVMGGVKTSVPGSEDKARLEEEARRTAMLLGSMYAPNLSLLK